MCERDWKLIAKNTKGVDRLVLERLKRKFDAGSSEQGFRYWVEMEERSRLLASHGAITCMGWLFRCFSLFLLLLC